jgi:5-oxoprolinase (ATP-hydrolysing) subunit B
MEAQVYDSKQRDLAVSASASSAASTKQIAQLADSHLKLSAAGAGALLFDPGNGAFDSELQSRLVSLAKRIGDSGQGPRSGVEVVLGVNNLMLIFDPIETHPDNASETLLRIWDTTEPELEQKRTIEIPVIYGGHAREDLIALASNAHVDVDEYVRLHSEATYSVACIGSMPGFAYLTGLPPELAIPRRKVPRMKVEEGTVIVGGVQAGVMPCTAPSGWHLLGRTQTRLFDAKSTPPCLLEPGNEVRFIVKGIEA